MFGIFGRREPENDRVTQNLREDRDDLISEAEELRAENKKLERELRKSKDELASTKHQKKLEEESLQHMIRIDQERREVEFLKREAELIRDKDKEIASVRQEYRDKIEKLLKEETTHIREMYSEILERLPHVTVDRRIRETSSGA